MFLLYALLNFKYINITFSAITRPLAVKRPPSRSFIRYDLLKTHYISQNNIC